MASVQWTLESESLFSVLACKPDPTPKQDIMIIGGEEIRGSSDIAEATAWRELV